MGRNYVGAWGRGAKRVEQMKRELFISVSWFLWKEVYQIETPLTRTNWNLGPAAYFEYRLGGREISCSSFSSDSLRHCLPLSFWTIAYTRVWGQVAIGFLYVHLALTIIFQATVVRCVLCQLWRVWKHLESEQEVDLYSIAIYCVSEHVFSL